MVRRKETGENSLLGRKIALLRESLDWNQSDLARASQVKRASISEYEAGRTAPDALTLERLLRAMNMQWSALDLAGWFLSRLEGERLKEKEEPSTPLILLQTAESEVREVTCRLSSLGELLERKRKAKSPGEIDLLDSALSPEEPKPEDRTAARSFWNRSKKLPQRKQQESFEELPGSLAWALSELLSIESQRLAASSPREALRLARLSLSASEKIPGDPAWRSKAGAIAWAHIGNALRVLSDFDGSEQAFLSAERLALLGQAARHHLLEEGIVPALKASLRRAERRLDEAAELLDQALAQGREPRFRAQVMVSKSKLAEEQGNLEEAISILQAADTLPAGGDGRLLLCIRHNMADYLSKLGRFIEAEVLLPEVRVLSRKVGGALDRVRFLWTEGRVSAGLGQVEEGIAKLTRVRGEFASRQMDFDSALVSLELAALYAGEGKTEEVKSLARHMVPIFQAKRIHRCWRL